MDATFLRGDYNHIWLFYADGIKVRRRPRKSGGVNSFKTASKDSFVSRFGGDA